VGLNVHWFVC